MVGWRNWEHRHVDLVAVGREDERHDKRAQAITCDAVREVLSASLDGETDATPAWVGDHLAGCADCSRWSQRAARLDRMLRVAPVEPTRFDMAEAVLAKVTLPRRGRWRVPLRLALAAVAVAQLCIGLASLLSPLGMADMAAMMNTHMDHEEAAFNIAFGVALMMVAWNGRWARGHVPVLATFVGMLAVSSVVDLADGAVTWVRLTTHLPILVGLVLAVVLGRGPYVDQDPVGRLRRDHHVNEPPPGVVSEPEAPEPVRQRHRGTPPPAARRDAA